MHDDLSLAEVQKEYHGTMESYLIGFLGSLLLTGVSFSLVIFQIFPAPTLIYIIVGLAIVQAIVQLIFFLHLGKEPKPRWESLVFFFMVVILLIIALGSIWIMNDLNDRMMMNMPKGQTQHD